MSDEMSDIPSITNPDQRDLYIRMEALRMAKECYSSGFPDNESIIKTAREFEAYLRGQIRGRNDQLHA